MNQTMFQTCMYCCNLEHKMHKYHGILIGGRGYRKYVVASSAESAISQTDKAYHERFKA